MAASESFESPSRETEGSHGRCSGTLHPWQVHSTFILGTGIVMSATGLGLVTAETISHQGLSLGSVVLFSVGLGLLAVGVVVSCVCSHAHRHVKTEKFTEAALTL